MSWSAGRAVEAGSLRGELGRRAVSWRKLRGALPGCAVPPPALQCPPPVCSGSLRGELDRCAVS